MPVEWYAKKVARALWPGRGRPPWKATKWFRNVSKEISDVTKWPHVSAALGIFRVLNEKELPSSPLERMRIGRKVINFAVKHAADEIIDDKDYFVVTGRLVRIGRHARNFLIKTHFQRANIPKKYLNLFERDFSRFKRAIQRDKNVLYGTGHVQEDEKLRIFLTGLHNLGRDSSIVLEDASWLTDEYLSRGKFLEVEKVIKEFAKAVGGGKEVLKLFEGIPVYTPLPYFDPLPVLELKGKSKAFLEIQEELEAKKGEPDKVFKSRIKKFKQAINAIATSAKKSFSDPVFSLSTQYLISNTLKRFEGEIHKLFEKDPKNTVRLVKALCALSEALPRDVEDYTSVCTMYRYNVERYTRELLGQIAPMELTGLGTIWEKKALDKKKY